MCTTQTAEGLYASIFDFKSSSDKHRSFLLQSTNSTLPPALITLSGVAINVFDGHSTVFPFMLKYSSAANVAPPQLENDTEDSPLCRAHFSANKDVNLPSDHFCVAIISSQYL